MQSTGWIATVAATKPSKMDLLIRGMLALFAGYGVAAIAQAALARTLPMARIDATMTATMLSFAIYAGAVVWAFAAHSARRAGIGLLIAGVAAAAVLGVAR